MNNEYKIIIKALKKNFPGKDFRILTGSPLKIPVLTIDNKQVHIFFYPTDEIMERLNQIQEKNPEYSVSDTLIHYFTEQMRENLNLDDKE